MTNEQDDIITSDLHLSKIFPNKSFGGLQLTSRFQIVLPQSTVSSSHILEESIHLDDTDVLRKDEYPCKLSSDCRYVTMSHRGMTVLDDVGMQLWRGALLLGDYLIYKRCDLSNKIILECGAGVGFLGIILSLLNCKIVYMTDYRSDILHITQRNFNINSHVMPIMNKCNDSHDDNDQTPNNKSVIKTRILNFHDTYSPRFHSIQHPCNLENTYSWNEADFHLLSTNELLVLGADIIYNDSLTENLFEKLSKILKIEEHFWLTFEKRFNFSIDELSLIAHGYRKFLNIVHNDSNDDSDGVQPSYNTGLKNESTQKRSGPSQMKTFEDCDGRLCYFSGSPQRIDFPQYVMDYDRVPELELWDIQLLRK